MPYCGANPVADMWSEKPPQLVARSFGTAVRDGDDVGARMDMAMAATFAGMGFGKRRRAHPHANAYPIAGRVKDYRPEGYPADEPLVPHGMSVSLTRRRPSASPSRPRPSATCARPSCSTPAPSGRTTRPSTCPLRS